MRTPWADHREAQRLHDEGVRLRTEALALSERGQHVDAAVRHADAAEAFAASAHKNVAGIGAWTAVGAVLVGLPAIVLAGVWIAERVT